MFFTKFTWEVVIDLIHLQDHIIGNTSLSQEDVQLAWHTTGHWVNTKPVGAEISLLSTLIDCKLTPTWVGSFTVECLGTVLGPILFSILMLLLGHICIHDINFHFYVDDTQI